MWNTTHELSATQIHYPNFGAHQHYSTAQIPHQHSSNPTSNLGKWNIAGQRSSYSLPHPGHTQSNMRWNKYEDKNHLVSVKTQPAHNFSNSTRILSTAPANRSFVYDQRQVIGASGVGIPRHRPASMYDPPNSMPNISYQFHSSGFMPQSKKELMKHHSKNNSSNIRQSPGDLVRLEPVHIKLMYYII